MAQRELVGRFQQRHDTSTNWKSLNPVLLVGEIGVETDSGLFKIGNGTNHWNELGYATSPIVETNSDTIMNIWVGTQEEFSAIGTPSNNTIYFIK